MNDRKKILVLFARPALHKSRVNRVLAQRVRGIDGVTFHDLYAARPEFDFLAPTEQALLAVHDIAARRHGEDIGA